MPPPPKSEWDNPTEWTLPKLRSELLRLREEAERMGRERTQAQVRAARAAPSSPSCAVRACPPSHSTCLPFVPRPLSTPPPPLRQVDRDAVERYYELSRAELSAAELAVVDRARAAVDAQAAHRLEVAVYAQKARALEFQAGAALGAVRVEGEGAVAAEEATHAKREALARRDKDAARAAARKAAGAAADGMHSLTLLQERGIAKMRLDFGASLAALRARYEARLEALRRDLRLRAKVELHEAEERKNAHMAQLVRAHEAAFAEMKAYYNGITKANVDMVATLKATIAEGAAKQAANQKLMLEIAEENKRLSDPLARAQAELAGLQADLKDFEEDKGSLVAARARLAALRRAGTELAGKTAALEAAYAATQAERDELYAKYEATVAAATERSAERAAALEARVAQAEADFAAKRAAVGGVLAAAAIDPAVAAGVAARVDALLAGRNDAIAGLAAGVAALRKAHNDAVRVYEARLTRLGVSLAAGGGEGGGKEDGGAGGAGATLSAAGIQLFPAVGGTTSAPAGLVAAPARN